MALSYAASGNVSRTSWAARRYVLLTRKSMCSLASRNLHKISEDDHRSKWHKHQKYGHASDTANAQCVLVTRSFLTCQTSRFSCAEIRSTVCFCVSSLLARIPRYITFWNCYSIEGSRREVTIRLTSADKECLHQATLIAFRIIIQSINYNVTCLYVLISDGSTSRRSASLGRVFRLSW